MFKAKLIEGQEYYRIKRLFSIYTIVAISLSVFMSTWVKWPYYVGLLILLLYFIIATSILQFKNKLTGLIGRRTMEIDGNNVSIIGVNKKIIEQIPISEVNQILYSGGLTVDEGLSVKNNRQFIAFITDNNKHQFDFELSSHYMAVQFEKMIKQFEEKGINTERH
ncbi:MAG: hypothetical protein JXR60_04360 [Bacteroidales bacterium]|nr:hypothetical protein [Bacteroidales bacterium]